MDNRPPRGSTLSFCEGSLQRVTTDRFGNRTNSEQTVFGVDGCESKWFSNAWLRHQNDMCGVITVSKFYPPKRPRSKSILPWRGDFLQTSICHCKSYLDVFPNPNSQLLIFWRVTVSSSHHIPTTEHFMKGLLRHHFSWGMVSVHSPFLTNTYCSAGWGWLRLNQHNCETIVSQLVVCEYILYL